MLAWPGECNWARAQGTCQCSDRLAALTGWHDTSAHVCRGDGTIGRLPKFVVARWWGTGHKVHLTTCASGSEAMSSAAVERLRDSRDLFDDSGDTAVVIIPPLEKSFHNLPKNNWLKLIVNFD